MNENVKVVMVVEDAFVMSAFLLWQLREDYCDNYREKRFNAVVSDGRHKHVIVKRISCLSVSRYRLPLRINCEQIVLLVKKERP